MGKYLLAHDLGTSGNKATLFSIEGQLIASCTYNYDVYYISKEDMCAIDNITTCGGSYKDSDNISF